MRVIAANTLREFVENRVEARHKKVVREQLNAWLFEAKRSYWANSAQLKMQFVSASIVTSERVVFNIKGNEFRLVVAIAYSRSLVLIKWIGTHKEYDRINAAEVEYDAKRYHGSSY